MYDLNVVTSHKTVSKAQCKVDNIELKPIPAFCESDSDSNI